jgi:hypothetical protein
MWHFGINRVCPQRLSLTHKIASSSPPTQITFFCLKKKKRRTLQCLLFGDSLCRLSFVVVEKQKKESKTAYCVGGIILAHYISTHLELYLPEVVSSISQFQTVEI